MVAKIIERTSLKGCVCYVLKEDSEIIDVNGLSSFSPETITRDFNLQRQLNPNLSKAVGHIVLAWHEKDSKRIDNSIMALVARQYLEKMGIKDTQYIAVRHYDRKHPHIHIIYNRVNYQGKTIANNYMRIRSLKLCKELNVKYRFHQAVGKENVNIGRLKGADKVKYQMFDSIKDGVKVCKDWNHLESFLKYKGIQIQFKYRGQTDEIQGISFTKDNYTFKGSEIDRSLSFNEINTVFNQQHPSIQSVNENNFFVAPPNDSPNHTSGFNFQINISHDQDDEAGKKKKRQLTHY